MSAATPALEQLRDRIRRLEGRTHDPRRTVLPFGIEAIDRALPGGGLMLGALHDIAGGGADAQHGAAAARFCATIAARTRGPVLWCVMRPDLFAPSLQHAGLDAARVIYVDSRSERDLLACAEEGLRHRGLGAVVMELARLPMIASRRLHLAAETSGVLALALRRWRRPAQANGLQQPNAAVTRWHVTAAHSAPLPVPGLGTARWHLDLVRCRGGEGARFVVEARDGTSRLALSADMVDRPGAQAPQHDHLGHDRLTA
ncbi:hypothetical protein AA103196_2219 [Ameyamaea chiangmaiensis NBRC 103196]|nr:damage-inducible protein [Ameyamaea chiangmaiensis]MBS4075521.1 damage-inducible protein [Ameyamaea chiangmaiensis]GBQ69448.1 hypothetical protein AA103196_2219 [Ameyamaea chiangmaiensis NBRC 103196]